MSCRRISQVCAEPRAVVLGQYAVECAPPSPIRPGYVRLGAARGIRSALDEHGFDPDRFIRESGLDPRSFDNGNSVVPFTALCRLVANAVRCTGCDHLALQVGQRAGLDSLGLLGALMGNSPTTGAALGALEAHLWIENGGAVPRLDLSGEMAVFSYSPYEPGTIGAALNSEGAIAATVSVLRELAGPHWSPQEVLLPRAAPPNLEPYRHFFRAPVRFDQDTAALIFPASFLSERIGGADPNALRAAQTRMRSIEAVHDRSLTDRIRRILRTELLKSRCSVSCIAARLSLNRRTLNRRLRAEGTTFREVADEVRFEIARQLIAETRLDLSYVAAALDFSEPCAFTRAFRRWSGQTPSHWRQLHSGAAAWGRVAMSRPIKRVLD